MKKPKPSAPPATFAPSTPDAPKKKVGGSKRWRWPKGEFSETAIRELAGMGCEPGDIEVKLGLGKLLAGDAAQRQRFEEIVAEGHAEFRISLAQRLHDDAVKRGKVTAQKEAAQAWLARYQDSMAHSWLVETTGAVERLRALIARVKSRSGE